MMGLVASEVRKLKSVSTTWVLTGIGLVIVALSSTAFLLFTGMTGTEFTGTDAQIATGIDQVGGMFYFVLVVGLLSMTTEFRHGTIGRTLQVTPGRTRVMVAKLVSGAFYAVAYFIVGVVVVGGVLLIAMLTRDVSLSFGSATWTALWTGALGLVLIASFGVAVGALLRNQVVALTTTLVWAFVVEGIVGGLASSIGRWMPFNALSAVFVSPETREMGGGMDWLLDPAVGLAVFIGYVVVAASAAVILMRTRDV